MTLRKQSILLVFLLCTMLISAQQSVTYTNELVDYQKALTLYNNKQYQASQSMFEDIKDQANNETLEADCAFYIANCAVRLNQKNADDLVQEFVNEYPTSTKRNTAYLDVADYYFNNAMYPYSRKWYDEVDEVNVPKNEREKFYFNYGYTLYATGNEAGANKYLNRVVNSKEYGSQAKYYIGFMAYEGDDYDKANEYFDQVSDNEKYKEKLSYYQADLNFKLGKFEEAIALALDQLENSSPQERSELSKIIGESYFNLQNYEQALPYLKDYKGKRGRWNNTDYYQLGYAYYKQNDFDNAISEFNKIIDGNNAVAQNAYYHLAESYINLDKKQEALNAFRNASQMDFDAQIQEDAWLNYAKISYEIGNPYQSVPEVLSGYLNTYPKTSYKEEIETLLIDSYITSKNYGEAIKLLENKKGFENRLAYQKVAFYRGVEVYNEGDFISASDFFDRSIREAKDPHFTSRGIFWKAETDYHLNNYNDALIGFKQFKQQSNASEVEEYEDVDYNIAYSYFKLKDYAQATSSFKSFLGRTGDDNLRRNDAYLRLGDGYFVSSNYSEAIKAYDEAIKINEIETDYAFFQKAMSYGYIGNPEKKISELNSFIEGYPSSVLRDDAMYELGNSYIKSNESSKGMSMYDRLLTEYPKSSFTSKTLLRQGLSYYNINDSEKALQKFKKVANAFPSTGEAKQAVATARLIYIDLGRVDEYASWVRTLDYVVVTDSELDNTAYLAAEKQYLDNNTDAAIRQFNKYLNEFP
ncbi:MAG: tetratricopeptide repeat protein, partial [Psychroserpens sp.]|nr:tetratricopeptide repeat protein [Psychroserpens sp.]